MNLVRSPLFSRISLGVVLLSSIGALNGCDKSTAGADAAPGTGEKAELKDDEPPFEASPSEFAKSGEPVETLDEPRSAEEPDLPNVEFDQSASAEFRRAFEELAKWVRSQKGEVHAALVDLESDKWLLRAQASEGINVASNAKIVTAAAALELLGPAYTFRTELLGDIDAEGRCARLVLRGGGAPDLSTADLWRLLRVAQGRGLSEVKEVVVDQSRFTDEFVPPAYEQQPNEWAPFRAPISALSLDENSVTLNVATAKSGEPAKVWYYPPGVVVPDGQVLTGEEGSGDRVTWSLQDKTSSQRLTSKVGGRLAEGLGRRTYSRRLEDPRLAGGYALVSLLKEMGVKVSGEPRLGKVSGEPRIALWISKPIAELVRALGKDSNNFYAEMLFVALSGAADAQQESDQAWSSARGAAVVTDWLQEKQIDLKGIVIKNGSGLFDGNRYSAELLVKLLAGLEDNPRIYQDFVSQLAIGGTDGTMKSRMKGESLAPRIRAKTGTLNAVLALSGYIQRTQGRSPAAFSITISGIAGRYSQVRSHMDRTVLAWARLLEESSPPSSPTP